MVARSLSTGRIGMATGLTIVSQSGCHKSPLVRAGAYDELLESFTSLSFVNRVSDSSSLSGAAQIPKREVRAQTGEKDRTIVPYIDKPCSEASLGSHPQSCGNFLRADAAALIGKRQGSCASLSSCFRRTSAEEGQKILSG
ncbi:unnamed protein product, partial [Musa textilis]